jgi:hypothetical protein
MFLLQLVEQPAKPLPWLWGMLNLFLSKARKQNRNNCSAIEATEHRLSQCQFHQLLNE